MLEETEICGDGRGQVPADVSCGIRMFVAAFDIQSAVLRACF